MMTSKREQIEKTKTFARDMSDTKRVQRCTVLV